MLFSIEIASAFLLRLARLPDSLTWLAIACIITGAVLSTLMQIRTNGTVIGVGGLFLIYYIAPEPSPLLASLLAFLAALMVLATSLLIAFDLSAMKENKAVQRELYTQK